MERMATVAIEIEVAAARRVGGMRSRWNCWEARQTAVAVADKSESQPVS